MDPDKEKALTKTHARFLELCIRSISEEDLDMVAVSEIMGFGTARDEIISGIQAAKNLLQLQREQSLGWEMDYKITPVFRRINTQKNSATMVDEVHLIMHHADQNHQLNLRITTCLECVDDQWKVVHWQGSIPQESTSEDTWHIGEWKRKTEELQKLVDEKTAQLLQQNRELEIEAALERVRSTAMAMHRPKDILNICEVVFKELLTLGFEALRNTIIHVFDDDKKYFTDYDYSDLAGGTIARIPFTGNSVLEKFIAKMRSSKDSFFEMEVSGKEFEAWKAFRKTTDMNEDPRLEDAQALYYYIYSVGAASIGISSFQTIGPSHLDLLKRFRNVFDLAYSRYEDIRKAEAQAREAQIEAALEKIRSRSLAANKTDEFSEVVKVVFEKLSELQIPVSSVTMATNKENSKDLVVYGCGEGEAGLAAMKFHLPYFPNVFVDDLIQEQSKSATGYLSKVYSEEDKNNYYDYVFKHTELKNLHEDLKDQVRKSKSYGLSTAYSGNSAIMVNDFEGNILNEGQADILKRFARVFEQAYTRFLDLQKAEAQAREAQIEAALERVRASSMAMHSSEELSEVAKVMFDQMKLLGGELFAFGIVLCGKHENMVEQWHSLGEAGMMTPFFVPIDLDYIHRYRYDQWKAGVEVFSIEIPSDYIKRHFELMFELPSVQVVKEDLAAKGIEIVPPPWEIDYGASFKHGYLLVSSFAPFVEETIFPRFAKVFEQTYTRFLDLQRAEAQAREAETEAALERVRSRSMAMHHSSELAQVIATVYAQFRILGFDAWGSALVTRNEARDGWNMWMYFTGQTVHPEAFPVPDIDHPVQQRFFEAWQQAGSYQVIEFGGTEKHTYDHQLFHETEWKDLPEPMKQKMQAFDHVTASIAVMPHSVLETVGTEPLPHDKANILQRFARVFEQSYTRFLDLKKAEAQAREAQIEAALERIRAASMAMHRTEELSQVISILFKQFDFLGFNPAFAHLTLFDGGDEWFTLRLTDTSGERVLAQQKISLKQVPEWIQAYESWKDGKEETVGIIQYKAEALPFVLGLMQDLIEAMPAKTRILAENYPEGFWTVQGHCKYGYLGMNITRLPNEEDKDIVGRFAREFGRIYQRFLDLQKAEQQAREAQIEAALERVRSRAMGMRHSDELNQLIGMVFTELTNLDLVLTRCIIMEIEKESMASTWWMSNSEAPAKPMNFFIKHHEHPPYLAYLTAWRDQATRLSYDLQGAIKAKWDEFLFSETELSQLPHSVIEGMKEPDQVFLSVSFNHFGCLSVASLNPLSDPQMDVLVRFSKVFEQTYTRFLDLQKAEAQARKAKIEAALEKVRSRTMAMHKADELHEVVTVVVERLMELGVILDANGVILCTYFPDSRDVLHWIASPDFSFTGSYLLPYFEHPIFRAAWESRSNGDEYFSKSFSVEEKNSFFEYAFEHSDYKYFPDEFKEWVFQNDKHSLSFAWTENAAILIPSHTGVVPEGEDIEILKRFARVFEQAYVRFMDLQKAEKATRETQIELSLERIRAQVTSMQESSDLLEIMVAMRKEFVALGHEAHYFWYMRWLPETYEKAMTSGDGTKIGNVMTLPRKIHKEIKPIAQWEKGNDPTIIHVMDAEAAIDYVHKMIEWGDFHQVDHNVPGDDDIRHIGGLTYVMARTSQGEIGYSLPGMVPDPPAEAVNTLRRFASVFDLAYSRFEDLREAELQSRKVLEERNRLEKTLTELRATQSQLIHSEKMASLGELTAGIAHEIQNPLNFVNNFSEVSAEMVKEIVEELEKGDIKETQDILQDLKKNLEKITHHGHRASSIVRSMLDHSRTSSGEKANTDLNALCDEYLRLAYHGMRAKERNFNATFETKLDPDLPRIKVVVQELGRVLLNLISNAFQAVNNVEQPKVIITTRNLGDYIEIGVTDNGHGIPDEIRDKIFQPFFTTKPTGQGTGLGLSLAYDIVKAHGGEIDVVSEPGTGTTFTLKIPIGSDEPKLV